MNPSPPIDLEAYVSAYSPTRFQVSTCRLMYSPTYVERQADRLDAGRDGQYCQDLN
jgi:hypothetical protein